MGSHRTATGLAHLASSDHAIRADAIARLDLIAIVLAGALIILSAWEWMKRR